MYSSPEDLDEDMTGNRQCMCAYTICELSATNKNKPTKPSPPPLFFLFPSFIMEYQNVYRCAPVMKEHIYLTDCIKLRYFFSASPAPYTVL